MKTNFFKFSTIALTVAAMALVLCCEDKPQAVPPEPPSLSVNPSVTDIVFTADGATLIAVDSVISTTFRVHTNQDDWDVTVTPANSWLRVSKSFNRFYLSAESHTGVTAPDAAILTVTSGNAAPVRIDVGQLAFVPWLMVTPKERDILFSADGKLISADGKPFNPTFTVLTNEAEWDAKSNQLWLTVTKNPANNTFVLSAENYTGSVPLEATVTVTGLQAEPVKIAVAQRAGNIPVEEISVTGDALVEGKLRIAKGATATLSAALLPVDHTEQGSVIVWEASNGNVTVTKNGAQTTVTAVNKGNAVITVRLQHNPSVKKEISVTIQDWADITSSKLKNYEKPFQGSVLNGLGNGYLVLHDWTYTPPSLTGNGIVRIAPGRDGVLGIWTWIEGDNYPVRTIENGKLFQTVELEAGSYVFNIYVNETYENGGDFYMVAVSGNDLPDTDDVKTDVNVLAYHKLNLDHTGSNAIPMNSNEKFSMEFEVLQKGNVSLGFAITFLGHPEFGFNQRVYINKVELLNLQ